MSMMMGSAKGTTLMSDYVTEFINYLVIEKGLSANTIKAYENDWESPGNKILRSVKEP